jgi:hypothetical protein
MMESIGTAEGMALLPELHALSCGLKAVYTWDGFDGTD